MYGRAPITSSTGLASGRSPRPSSLYFLRLTSTTYIRRIEVRQMIDE
jgi:hypothetical protein